MSTDRVTPESFFQSLVDLRQTKRGRRHALRATAPPQTIDRAANFLNCVGIVELIEAWMITDSPNRARGVGRPEVISPRTFLTAFLACAFADIPVSLTTVHHVLTAEMPKAARRSLGLPVDPDPARDKVLEDRRRMLGYDCVTRTATKVSLTFDPRPFPSRRGLTIEEIATIEAARDPEVVALKQLRADEVQSRLLIGTFNVIPEHLRRRWTGDITLDATVVPLYGKRGHHDGTRSDSKGRSPEVNAGLHSKSQDDRDALAEGRNVKSKKETHTFGYDAHLALMTAAPEVRSFPRMIIGMSVDRPGVAPGQNAITALRGIRNAGLPAGLVTTDLGYSTKSAQNYALPVRAMGYELMHMFKQKELGISGAKSDEPVDTKGLICVEGTIYGPCIPRTLINASIDFNKGRIDEETYLARIEARRPFEARIKRNREGDLSAVFRCPGCGDGRTVKCDLKEVSPAQERREVAAGRTMLPLIVSQPKELPPICANAQSVSIPRQWAARYLTAMPYKTPEWSEYYAQARNEMEGRNRYLKDRIGGGLRDPGERRFRGYAKQVLTYALKIVSANIGNLTAWIDDFGAEEADHDEPPRRRPGRPKQTVLEDYTADLNAPPVRTVEPQRPDLKPPKRQRRAA